MFTFLDALENAEEDGKRLRMVASTSWSIAAKEGNKQFLVTENGDIWWPYYSDQKAKVWEVEQKKIFVWGACDDDGQSCLYNGNPVKTDGNWSAPDEVTLAKDNLFSKHKPRKFELVPAKEEEK